MAWVLGAFVLLLPSVVFAQSAMTGVVRDESGAVLPGVTVEASSPALIEKVRSAITDDQGRYQITDLRPGSQRVQVLNREILDAVPTARPSAITSSNTTSTATWCRSTATAHPIPCACTTHLSEPTST
jgi:hypothetical protein